MSPTSPEFAHPEEPPDGSGSLLTAVLLNPVVQTLALMSTVSLVSWTAFASGAQALFVLRPPVFEPPWTLVTSVYAHLGPQHLVSNAVMIAIAGGLVSLMTSRIRFHLFFLGTGVLSGLVQVWASNLFGPTAVLGASGAAFALMGYLITGNVLSAAVFDRVGLSSRTTLIVVVLIAGFLTIRYSAPGSGYLAHLSGALMGLAAGRVRLLQP